MQSVGVQQLNVLSELFAEVLHHCCPASVAILGIAGGNGLEHIDPHVTSRVVGVDVNESYLHAVRERFSLLNGLELHRFDLAESEIHLEPVQLVHAALIFEHAGIRQCLENALSLVADRGYFSPVLQLPSVSEQNVAPSEFTTIQNLKPRFSLIDPEWLQEDLKGRGWKLQRQNQRELAAGKALWMGIFRRS